MQRAYPDDLIDAEWKILVDTEGFVLKIYVTSKRGTNYMNSTGVWNTTGLFIIGTFCMSKGIEGIASENSLTLFTASAIFFPSAVLIGIVTKKIFDTLGWHPSETRELVMYSFTVITSTILASIAIVRFGLTVSLSTGFKIHLIAIQLIFGTLFIIQGMQNIFMGTNHQIPRDIRLPVSY